jgi:hypothetical protein
LIFQESKEIFPTLPPGPDFAQRKAEDDPEAGIDYALEALHKQEAGIDYADGDEETTTIDPYKRFGTRLG